MGKPNYRVVVSFDPARGVFTARTPELDHLSGEGPTRGAAMGKLEEEIDAQLANMLSLGTTPPRAVDEIEHTGEVQAKISRSLHRDLAYLAGTEGIEINQIVSELLASALAMRQGGRQPSRPTRSAPADMSDDIGNRADGNRVDGPRSDGNRADGNRRPFGGRGPNPAIMEDRANFIEYVRGLENGAPGGRPHGGGGQGGGGGGGHRGAGGGGGGDNRRRRGRGGGGGHPQGGGRNDGGRNDGGRMHGGGRPHGGSQGGGQPSAAAPSASVAAASAPAAGAPRSDPQE